MFFVITILAMLSWLIIPLMIKNRGARWLLYVTSLYFIQDPLRKILPGYPVYLQLAFSAGVMGLYLFQRGPAQNTFPRWANLPFAMMGPLIAMSILGFFRLDFQIASPMMLILGFFTYIFFVPMIFVAQRWFREEGVIFEYMRGYIMLASVQIIGVLVEFISGPHIHQGIGYTGHLYDDKSQEYLDLGIRIHCGFFQSGEPMVSNFAIAFAFCLALANREKSRLLYLIMMLAFFATSFLGVRRKGLILFISILMFYLVFIAMSRKQLIKQILKTIFLVIILSSFAYSLIYLSQEETPALLSKYYQRFVLDTQKDAIPRIKDMTVGHIMRVHEKVGIWGVGTGFKCVGSQHFSDLEYLRLEGGIANIYAEMGILGVFALFMMAIGMVTIFIRVRKYIFGNFNQAVRLSITGLLVGYSVSFILSSGMIKLYYTIYIIWTSMGMLIGLAENNRRKLNSQIYHNHNRK